MLASPLVPRMVEDVRHAILPRSEGREKSRPASVFYIYFGIENAFG